MPRGVVGRVTFRDGVRWTHFRASCVLVRVPIFLSVAVQDILSSEMGYLGYDYSESYGE